MNIIIDRGVSQILNPLKESATFFVDKYLKSFTITLSKKFNQTFNGKNKMIEKSGYFKLHEMCLAGQVVCSDGSLSQWCVTKSQALEICEVFVGIGITPEELLAIKEQIHASPLPSHDEDLENMVSQFQGCAEEMIAHMEALIKHFKSQQNEGEDWKE